MIDRSELQIPRRHHEIDAICQSVFEDRENYPSDVFFKRKGIVKDIVEEYWPLGKLVEFLGCEFQGNLTDRSNEGPDAIIENGNQTYSVQITSGNESYNDALSREMMIDNFMVFPDQEKVRDNKTKEVTGRGRALTTREGKLKRQVQEVLVALNKKICKFHENTDVLLITTEISLLDTEIEYSWQQDLCENIASIENVRYKLIYIVHNHGVFDVSKCITCGST